MSGSASSSTSRGPWPAPTSLSPAAFWPISRGGPHSLAGGGQGTRSPSCQRHCVCSSSLGQSQLVSSRCEGEKQTNPQLSSGPGGSIAVDVTLGACELPVCAAKASTPPSSGFNSGEVNEDQSLRTGQPYSYTRVSSYLEGEMRMEWCNIGLILFGILFLNAVLTRF